MLKHRWRLISRIERVLDNLLIVAAFLSAYFLRDYLLEIGQAFNVSAFDKTPVLGPINGYYIVLGIALPFFNAFISFLGGYRSMRFTSYWGLFKNAFISSLLVFFVNSSLLFLLKLDISRSFVGLFCGLAGFFLFFERALVLVLLRMVRAQGRNYRNLLIVGTGEQATRIKEEVLNQEELGVRIIGFVNLEGFDAHHEVAPEWCTPIIATCETFESALKRHAIDEVVFTDVVANYKAVRELAAIAADEGIRVTLLADLFSLELAKSEISYYGPLPLIHYSSSPAESSAMAAKRMIDFLLSAAALVVLSPLMAAVALVIKLDSPGPVLFRQKRVGLNGRKFTLLKFRSMVEDAESLIEELKKQNEMQGPVFKLKNDPRITRVGSFIRRYSIDELPQFFNVLKGDMSLVGPRPPLPEEVSLYERKQRRRLSMRPGLTCTWQVSGRNEIPDFKKWAELDLEYIDNWSLSRDFYLLCKTIPAVLSGSGAR